ncbi:MAG: ATP-binding protein [Myxococcota bacterium]
MSVFAVVKILTALVSIGLGAGLLARDHGLKGYRLLAAVMFCNAWWSSGEFLMSAASSPSTAEWLIRMNSLGIVPLGVLCMHAALEFSSVRDQPLSRTLPFFYASVVCLAPLNMFTDIAFRGVAESAFFWRPLFGPGILLSYAVIAAPVFLTVLNWRAVIGTPAPGGQRELVRVVFFGVSGALVAGTTTILILPQLGIDAMNTTSTLLALVGLACVDVLRRLGHSLTSSQAFAREILDALTDGYVLVTDEGIVRDVNRSFLRMAGTTESQAIGASIEDWIEGLGRKGGAFETAQLMSLRGQENESVPVVVSPSIVSGAGVSRLGRAYLLRDRREVIDLQRKLVRAARLAAVGDLAKSISQAISAPVLSARQELEGLELDWRTIGDVICLSDLEAQAKEAFEEGTELIEECAEGVDRIFSIVQEVGGFSEESTGPAFHTEGLDHIVARAMKVAGVRAGKATRIEVRMDEDVELFCRASEIERVVINLVVNAIQALQEGESEKPQLSVAVIAQGRRVLLHVEDNGCGISADVLDRVFDPFFTTKPVGEGTGLGLAISYHIVKAHDGDIRISSEQNGGTSVAVEFPRAPQRTAPSETLGQGKAADLHVDPSV